MKPVRKLAAFALALSKFLALMRKSGKKILETKPYIMDMMHKSFGLFIEVSKQWFVKGTKNSFA